MQGIGERLRQARIRQDIDVAAVEQATKIRVKYLRAMENEEFGLLPGPTFAISFLRTYAQFLGLDAHLLVREYRTLHLEPDEDELSQQYTSPERERRRMSGQRFPRPRLGLVAGLVLVALLAALFVLGRTSQEPAPPKSATLPSTAPEPSASAPDPAEAPRRRSRQGSATTVSLRVAPVGSTYLCVLDAGGDVMYAGILEQPRTFRGRRLRVNVGRRSARLTVNGRRVAVEQGPAPVGFDLRPRARPRMLTGEQRPACA